MLDCQFWIHASKGPVIIMNQLKSIYNSPFKDSHSHPIHTCFPIIDSNAPITGLQWLDRLVTPLELTLLPIESSTCSTDVSRLSDPGVN